jgi:putative ABC transport system permease protein
LKRSLRSWLWRVDVHQEVDEEIAFHIDMRTRELIDRGVDPKSAREIVLARVGDVRRLKRTCVDLGTKRDRDMRLTRWLEELRHDVTFAVRQLRRSPGFTAVAAMTLALGIGANGAIFALVDAAVLRPLPLPEPDRLVIAWDRSDAVPRGPASPLNMLDWNDRSRTFEGLAGFVPGVGSMVMAGPNGTAGGVPRQWVTSGVFDVLGVRAVAGRTFLPSDDHQQVSAVVLSEGFWRTRFGSDASVIGRQIRLDGMPFTVVGVVPEHARLIGSTSIWALIQLRRDITSIPGGPSPDALRATRVLRVIGRTKPGVSLETANADIAAVAADLAREFPRTNAGRSVLLEPLHDVLIGSDLRLTSLLFLGVVGFVLLICCANVANLLLARAAGRTKELAIRSALGAGRRRIVRQLLTESLVLASIGGALGIVVGVAILRAARSMIPDGLLPTAVAPTFDVRVLAFCAVTACLVGLVFGVAPAWHTRPRPSVQVGTAGTRTTTSRSGRLRSGLVVAEVAAAVLLLFGAGLLLRTLMAVDSSPRGYRADDVLSVYVDPLGGRYPTKPTLLQFFADVEREVTAVANVRRTAWASTLPLGESTFRPVPFEIVGDAPLDENQRPTADYQIVSPSYFETIDLPIVAGRGFTDADTAGSAMVCMVNEAFVRRHLQGRSTIGARIVIRSPASNASVIREIVGVARQIKQRPDDRDDFVQVYIPLAQDPFDDIFLLARPRVGAAAALAPAVRAAIGKVDTDQLVTVGTMVTLDEVAFSATARHRFRAWLVMAFASLALLLSMVGVFGVLAFAVQQRIREFGIRIALGATTGILLSLVLGSAARLIAAGTVIGLAVAALLARSMSAFLYGVQPLDPVTFVSVTIALALTAAVAMAMPAMRATHVDPVVAFRAE